MGGEGGGGGGVAYRVEATEVEAQEAGYAARV